MGESSQSLMEKPSVMHELVEEMHELVGEMQDDDDDGIDIELEPDSSVYQDAVFMPLVRCTNRAGKWQPLCHIYFKVMWMLLLNAVLQFFMAYKMLEVSETTAGDFKGEVTSLCQVQHKEDMPWMQNYSLTPLLPYFDCGPLIASIMSTASFVDFDNDGNWTFAEAKELQANYNGFGGRVGTFKKVFWGSNYYIDADADVNRNISMSWLRANQDKIQLCVIQDPSLCANMDVRGLLKPAFPGVRGKEPRIRLCKEMFDSGGLCTSLFGARFDWYVQHRTQICGDPTFEWDSKRLISTVSFAAAQKWKTNPDSVSSTTFISFLLLIITVWFMLMMGEFHQCVRWLIVLMNMPTSSTGERLTITKGDDGKFGFQAIPAFHRNIVLLFVWLPRVIIFGLTTFVGTIFLGSSTDYIDLLLNATALGFLIEIDQMLHSACTDDKTRQQVGSCAAVTIKTQNWFLKLHERFFTLTYSLLLIGLSTACVWYINGATEGNLEMADAVLCLCEVRGPKCLANAILLGSPTDGDDDF